MFAKHNLLNQSAKSPKSNSMATSLGANLYFQLYLTYIHSKYWKLVLTPSDFLGQFLLHVILCGETACSVDEKVSYSQWIAQSMYNLDYKICILNIPFMLLSLTKQCCKFVLYLCLTFVLRKYPSSWIYCEYNSRRKKWAKFTFNLIYLLFFFMHEWPWQQLRIRKIFFAPG